MKNNPGYRVYVNATLRGVFDDNDVEHQVHFHPNMSRKEVDALIDDLNEDVSPVEDDLSWLWIYTNNRSRAIQRQMYLRNQSCWIIHNILKRVSRIMIYKRNFETLRKMSLDTRHL